nr:DUF2946 family protein [Entomohabitans teleogrylli]
MLFAAPLISTSLLRLTDCHTMAHSASAERVSTASAHDDAHSAPPSAEIQAHHTMIASGTANSPLEDILCGYCQLLVHLPVILLVALALAWLMLCIARQRYARSPALPCLFRPWFPHLARAPPAF